MFLKYLKLYEMQRRLGRFDTVTMRSVSVVIPTYNGRALLEKNLPPLMRVLACTSGSCGNHHRG